MTEKELTKLASEQLKQTKGFIAANNYNVIKVSENYCELEGITTDTSTNHLGYPHGGYIFGLADTAAGIAAMTNGKTVVTINSNIEYFKSSKCKKLKAIAKSLKNGKNISFYEVMIYDIEENLIAKANINYYYLTDK